jgi:hypothetical protein
VPETWIVSPTRRPGEYGIDDPASRASGWGSLWSLTGNECLGRSEGKRVHETLDWSVGPESPEDE